MWRISDRSVLWSHVFLSHITNRRRHVSAECICRQQMQPLLLTCTSHSQHALGLDAPTTTLRNHVELFYTSFGPFKIRTNEIQHERAEQNSCMRIWCDHNTVTTVVRVVRMSVGRHAASRHSDVRNGNKPRACLNQSQGPVVQRAQRQFLNVHSKSRGAT